MSVATERFQLWAAAALGEEHAQEVYAGEAGGVAVDGFDFVQRLLVRDKLRTAKTNGLAHLTETIATYPDYDADFRQSYLGGHIQYDLGKEEKSGLEKFVELLKTHGEQEVFAPLFV